MRRERLLARKQMTWSDNDEDEEADEDEEDEAEDEAEEDAVAL